jgi:hypothetical protein
MIRVLDGMPEGVLGLQASGKLSAEDYTQVLIPAIAEATSGGAKLRVFMDFTEKFEGMEAGAVWEDLKTGIRDWGSWERIALVTDTAWMRDGLRMFAWAVPGQAKAFSSAERDNALAWVAAA